MMMTRHSPPVNLTTTRPRWLDRRFLFLLAAAVLGGGALFWPSTPWISSWQQGPRASDTTTLLADRSTSCGVWLAPSSIPGAGWGLFAGRDFDRGASIMGGVGDTLIPLTDVTDNYDMYRRLQKKPNKSNSSSSHSSTHRPPSPTEEEDDQEEEEEEEYNDEDYEWLWDDYTWNCETLHMHTDSWKECSAASTGFGAVVNAFLPLSNLEEYIPQRDSAGLHRARDPGAGALTPFHNRKTITTRSVQAGEEFLVSYGESWFTTRPHLGPVPLSKRHLQGATQLAQAYHRLQDTLAGKNSHHSIPSTWGSDLWNTFVQQSAFRSTSRVLGSFDFHDASELEQLRQRPLQQLRQQQRTRSIEWLEQHGSCVDHLTVGPSTLRQAGRGALAQRFLPAGSLVAPMPLIHMTDRERLRMYRWYVSDPAARSQLLGYQLLLNYCFGHAQSTVLLCPYASLALHVNHNQTLANVRVRWAQSFQGRHNATLLSLPLEVLDADPPYGAKLALELVATRDIQPGEEIFLDYGDEWEAAWQAHVEQWRPVEGADAYVPAEDWNQLPTAQRAGLLRTSLGDLQEHPYPPNWELRCDSTFAEDEKGHWKWRWHQGTLEQFLEDYGGSLWPCQIESVEEMGEELWYHVAMYEPHSEDHEEEAPESSDPEEERVKEPQPVVVRTVVPLEAFSFVNRPYTADYLFLENAFRHDVRMPDEIFPRAWRNRA